MRQAHVKYGVLGVLVLALLLGLLLAAGPAAATTNTITWAVMGELDYGVDLPTGGDGTLYGADWVAYGWVYRATGPDGWRFLGYGVVCLDTVIPPKGDNYHSGEVAWLSEDPGAEGYWDDDRSFEQNLLLHQGDLLWTGTWDGSTRNKYNHNATMVLDGCGIDNDGYTAVIAVKNGLIDIANWHAGRYVASPWNMVARVTAR